MTKQKSDHQYDCKLDLTKKDLTILIPCYNEANSIGSTIEKIDGIFGNAGINFEIICINNNSLDNTELILKSTALKYKFVRYFNSPQIQGFGIAVKCGLEHCESRAVVIIMADGSEDPIEILQFYKKFEEGYDCVFGTRFLDKSFIENYPRFKLFLNRLGNNFLSFVSGARYNDFTSGFKCYDLEKLKNVGPFFSNGFNLNVEMSLKFYLSGTRMAVMKNSWRERKTGISKFNVIKKNKNFIFTILYILLKNKFLILLNLAKKLLKIN